MAKKTFLRLCWQFVPLFSLLAIFFITTSSVNAAPFSEKIIAGTSGQSTLFPAVAAIFIDDNLCTGTLIDPEYVLTAGHCVFDGRGHQVKDMSRVSLQIGNQTRGAKIIYLHPQFNYFGEACSEGHPDASLIQLDKPVTNTAAIRIATAPPLVGSQLLLVGYGMLGSGEYGQTGYFPADDELSYGFTQVDKVSPTFVSWKFRPNQNNANTAGGDSGGPAFQTIAGEQILSAITCGGTGNAEWGTYSYDTRVDILSAWLLQYIGRGVSNNPPQITVANIISAQLQKSLSAPITVKGAQPIKISVFGLPDGLRFDGRSIVGIPTKLGDFILSIRAENSTGSATAIAHLMVKKAETNLRITSTRLRIGAENVGNNLLEIRGKVTSPISRLKRNRRLTLVIGNYRITFPLGLNSKMQQRKSAFFSLSRVSYRKSHRATLSFKARIRSPKVFDEIYALGFPQLSSASFGLRMILPTKLYFDGTQVTIDQVLSLDSSDLRWHLVD